MSIETQISELTESIKALTAAVNRLHSSLPGSAAVAGVPSVPTSNAASAEPPSALRAQAPATTAEAAPSPASKPKQEPVAAAVTPSPAAPAPAEVTGPSIDTVRAALVALGKMPGKGKPVLTTLLAKYGATKLSDVEAAKLGELFADIKSAEAA